MLNVLGCGPTHKIHTHVSTHTRIHVHRAAKSYFFRRILVMNMKEETMNLLRKNIWNSCNKKCF